MGQRNGSVKDQNGLYYYPFPGNRQVRMYVRSGSDGIEFRLWNQQDPMLWTEHGWVPWKAVQEASSMYRGGKFNPQVAYDIKIARALLAEDRSDADSQAP